MCCGARIHEIQGVDKVERVVCEHGDVLADLVLIGIGAIPNTEVAEEAGLTCDSKIYVDEFFASHLIFMPQAITNHPNALLKRRLRLGVSPQRYRPGACGRH